jgi:pyruvate formate lyase activating enzyme
MRSGLIFDVNRYAINDGPGIRVTFFLKGCPLECSWCHNPEGISPDVQKMYNATKCIGCNTCVESCPENACTPSPDGIVTDFNLCTSCGICAEVCPTNATEMSGKLTTVEEIVTVVEKERIFFDQSGGGVTFSGGEPLMQADFLITLLDELGRRSIHRTVDTTGFAKTKVLLEVAKRTDHFLYDLKMMNPERHKKWTGVDNRIILENLQLLAATGATITIRIPLVKGVNDDDENIEQTALFVANLEGEKKSINILPYHNIAAGKHQRLGGSYDDGDMSEPGSDELDQIIAKFAQFDIKATIGG